MKGLGRAEYGRKLSAGSIVVGVLAIISVLWFSTAHYFNATNAGWGDQEQDLHQRMLGWGILTSVIVALSCASIVAIRSRRALISIATGIAVSALAAWVPFAVLVFGLPGWLAVLFTFGVHSGGGYEVAVYFFTINACVYGGVAFLLLWLKSKH